GFVTTNEKGTLNLPPDGKYGDKHLIYGETYWVVEQTKDGYTANSTAYKIKFESANDHEQVAWLSEGKETPTYKKKNETVPSDYTGILNVPVRQTVTLTKNEIASESLPGAEFVIYDKAVTSQVPVATLVYNDSSKKYELSDQLSEAVKTKLGITVLTEKNAQGIKYLDNAKILTLLYGQYEIKEIIAPNGYKVSSTQIEIETKDFSETVIKNLTDNQTSITFVKNDQNGKTAKEATFSLKGSFKSGSTPITWTSDGNPHVINNELIVGQTYTLTETESAEAFQAPQNAEFTFKIADDGKIIELQTKKDSNVKATANEATLTMVNNRVYANAKLTKVDDSTAHRPISGAIFELHKTGYTTGTADQVIKSNLSTNAQGVINTSTLTGTYTDTDDVTRNFGQNSSHNGLTVGSYYFKETTTPASYKDGDNQNIAFTIFRGDDGLTKVIGEDTVDSETVVLNNLMNTKLKLFKYTEKDTGLKDAEFTLICVPADGQPQETIIGKTGTDGLMVDTATGQAISLKRGTYTLTETKATPGYELKGTDGNAFSCRFIVGNDDADKTLVIVEAGTTGLPQNEKVVSYVPDSITNTAALTATGVQNTEIVVTLNKTDGVSEPLTGATFTLSGQMAKKGAQSYQSLPLAMKNQSKIVINSKTLGDYSLITGETYTLKETVQPAGYQKHEEVIFKVIADGTGEIELVQTTPSQTGVTVDTDKTTLTVADVQTLATIELIKAGEDGSPLANVSFSLYKKGNDQAIQNGQTGLDGTLIFKNLAEGTYYFKETATPDDYALDTAPTQGITIGEK
ncbi:MAG: SpaA isopeptide-forming pilin-related protein, partial [Oscillospiraceae bacterium]